MVKGRKVIPIIVYEIISFIFFFIALVNYILFPREIQTWYSLPPEGLVGFAFGVIFLKLTKENRSRNRTVFLIIFWISSLLLFVYIAIIVIFSIAVYFKGGLFD